MQHCNIQKYFHALMTLVLVCLLQSAYAALPSTLNYQGHLTDNNGTPIDGSVNITFRIYNTQTDFTPLWMDSQTVTVNQGVFSVELGGFTTNPFPPGMFENPLWIGLIVGSDAEMTPRRPITSTGFAYKADDANTLEGVSASTLDQSAHVTDTANPHNVTASQIGAADAGTLASHIGNTANPHSVTATQTGAASSGDFTAHASNSAAHHPRYNDGEAVSAMGSMSDANALNHEKYSNANAVAAILAADGAGSTLDADKVDGLQASELIDAAQDEVRTPISSLPYTISQSGSYYLTGNLDGSSGGINITADKVTLDLMGFTIDGGGTVNDYGIDFTGRSSISIRNGFIANFGLAGIYQGNTSARYATVIDVQTLNNGMLGTGAIHSGIYLGSSNCHVERCTAGDNGGDGIYANRSSKLINNTAFGNTGSYGILGSSSSTLSGNTAYNNENVGIYGGAGSTLSGNTVYSNIGNSGIVGSTGSILSGNTAYDNSGTYGIYGGSGAYLNGNTAYNNTGISGIYGYLGASLVNNVAYNNSNWGMYGTGSNLVKDNTIISNNTSAVASQGGLRVYNDSRVVGNTLDSNSRNNIYVSSSDNIFFENHVTDSINGIFFSVNGNYYRENTGAGNTTTFNLNGTAQTDGGDNVAF